MGERIVKGLLGRLLKKFMCRFRRSWRRVWIVGKEDKVVLC